MTDGSGNLSFTTVSGSGHTNFIWWYWCCQVMNRSNLGLANGSDVQAYNPRLAEISSLAVTDGGIIVGNGSNFLLKLVTTLRTSKCRHR